MGEQQLEDEEKGGLGTNSRRVPRTTPRQHRVRAEAWGWLLAQAPSEESLTHARRSRTNPWPVRAFAFPLRSSATEPRHQPQRTQRRTPKGLPFKTRRNTSLRNSEFLESKLSAVWLEIKVLLRPYPGYYRHRLSVGYQFPKMRLRNITLAALHEINFFFPWTVWEALENLILLQAQHLTLFIIQLKMCEIAS